MQLLGGARDTSFDLRDNSASKIGTLGRSVRREQPSLVAVVEIGGAVSDLVGQVDELRLERRTLVEQIFGEFRMFLRRRNRASA